MKEEIWKPIKDFEDSYEVSNKGRVRSLDRFVSQWNGRQNINRVQKGKIMNPACNGIGYLQVKLSKEGKYVSKYVHRLVIETFYYESGLDVNHIDHNKTNNILSNLEYVTKSENQNKSREFYGTIGRTKIEVRCTQCGELKSSLSNSEICYKCSSFNNRKVKNRPSKEQLMEDLKGLPYTKVGKKYGVSDNTIRKWLL